MAESPDWSADDAWKCLVERDFRSWRGLPAGARYADFDGRFRRLVDAEAVGLLGTSLVSARSRMYAAEGYPQNLKAWFAAGQLLAVEAVSPSLPHPPEEVRAALGEPSLRLDSGWGELSLPGGLHVFTDRGIALLIGPQGQVLRLVLFRAGADFVTRIHTESRPVDRP